MHASIIFGFMLPVAAIRIWKPVTGVDWKTALFTCSAKESKLPRVRVNNNRLELVDDIASKISNTFWLGASYETIQIDPFNDNDLEFPHLCCGAFPALSDTCMNSCISCNENHAYKCKISPQSYLVGVGPWIQTGRMCSPSTLTHGDKDIAYWNQDIRRLSLNLTTSGQEQDTCTYFCAGSVLIRECSDSSGIDTVCVTDKVGNLYPSNTSTVSTYVSTHIRNSSLPYTDGTLSTHFSTDTVESTEDSTSIRTQVTEHSSNKTTTSTLHMRSTSIAFVNSTLKSPNDTYASSSRSKRELEENWILYWGITGAVSIILTVSMIVMIILVIKLRQVRRQVVHARKNDRISMKQLDEIAPYQNLDHRNRDSKNIYDTLAP